MTAGFYEFFEDVFDIFIDQFSYIFDHIYDNNGYGIMFLILIVIPLVTFVLFYYVYRNPYATRTHWALLLVLTALIVAGSTFGYSRELLIDYILSGDSDEEGYALKLTLFYSALNGGLSLIVGILWSLLLKQWSKLYMHLPILKP